MFRPAGTTPGHSFEFARLLLQHWDLNGRPEDGAPERARRLFETALRDGTDPERGGIVYTVDFDGRWMRPARYWWPVTEAIGAAAAFLKLDGHAEVEAQYRAFWRFADGALIDHEKGGWFCELDAENRPAETQFSGKPDIYHALQATLFPLCLGLSDLPRALEGVLRN